MAAARIDGIVARDANVAVVFRRGPSRLFQMLLWDLDTDEVMPGQWIHAKVYTKRCDISPDGRYVVVACTDYSSRAANRPTTGKEPKDSWDKTGWTAVSKPPYFSALALWFNGCAWNGGGIWRGPKEIALNNFHGWFESLPMGKGFKVLHLDYGACEDEPIFTDRLKAHGWKSMQEFKVEQTNKRETAMARKMFLKSGFDFEAMDLDAMIERLEAVGNSIPQYRQVRRGIMDKSFAAGRIRRIQSLDAPSNFFETWQIVADDGRVVREFAPKAFHPQWLDVDHNGRVVFGDGGCLWAWEGCPHGKPKKVADLNANKYEDCAPPNWALCW